MRMKTNFISMFALAAMLASCSNNDDVLDVPSSVQEGIPTTARLTLNQAGVGTRAIENATDPEKAIRTATVYVVNSQRVLEKIVKFTSAEITGGSKTFVTTVGKKYFYVAVNIPDTQLGTIVEGMRQSVFEKHVLTITAISEATSPVAGDTGGYWMTSVTGATEKTLESGTTESNPGANVVTINVGRATAKVSVAMGTNPTVAGGAFELTGYKMVNNAKKSYLTPVIVDGAHQTPNYDEATVTAADYFDYVDFQTTEGYITENTHRLPKVGNATTAVIRGKYTPTTVLDGSGNTGTANGNGDFWRIRKTDLTYTDDYYSAVPTADEINAKTNNDNGAEAVKYTDGTCYYRLVVRDNTKDADNEKYAVIRNNFYKIAIVNVNGAGSNTENGIAPGQPGAPNPEEPAGDAHTFMKATIEILPWNVIHQNGGI